MLQNEIAVNLLTIFMWVAGIGIVLGLALSFLKNKVLSAIGKGFLVLAVVSIIALVVLVFMQSPPTDKNETITTETIGSASFDEIYYAYKENELRADDTYKNNRYRITAEVKGMATGGLLNLTGGATLTMEKMVGNTHVIFYAEFEKEQEDALKLINMGDTITFEGECLSAGSWTDCEIITE